MARRSARNVASPKIQEISIVETVEQKFNHSKQFAQCGCVVNEAKKQAEANKASAGDQVGGQDKIVVILVAIFIGTLGIHNFIMGETKKGVFKLVMSLVGGWFCGLGVLVSLILTIMDIVKIASGTYVVDPDKLI